VSITRSIYDGPPNGYTDRRTTKRYITVHCTANDASAAGEAAYAKRRTDDVSSHYYADRTSVVQSLDTDLRAWHSGSAQGNDWGIAYELVGLSTWSRATWLASIAWDKVAAQMAVDCREHGIAVRDLTLDEIRAGKLTGFITHSDCRLVWGGTDHVCPGANFPMDHLVAQVHAALNGDNVSTQEVIDALKSQAGRDAIYNAVNRDVVQRYDGNGVAIPADPARPGDETMTWTSALTFLGRDSQLVKKALAGLSTAVTELPAAVVAELGDAGGVDGAVVQAACERALAKLRLAVAEE
jgi:N-acetyl-anhydromuramyl-L-alanine amidase AmpD